MPPLEGLKVLDLSTLLPGPYATLLLADLGADVLRVESPSRPDLVRNMSPQIDGQSAAFRYLNRGKQSLALNLKHPDAKGVIHQLLADYDILVEQFRPGVMARLGLDYDSLKAVNPALIYCSITGYGQEGPYRERAGHDINYLALSGIASHMGTKSQGPTPPGVQIADTACGSHPAVIAILAAVIQRQATGRGQQIDIAMADNALALQPLLAPGALNGEAAPEAESMFLNGGGFYGFYRTADNRYLSIGSLEPQFRKRLVEAIGLPELAEVDDTTLKTALQDCIAAQSYEFWCRVFADVDACVEPVLNLSEAADFQQFKERGLITTDEQGMRQVACPLRFDQQLLPTASEAPLCGENTREVMRRLGYEESEISTMARDGVFN